MLKLLLIYTWYGGRICHCGWSIFVGILDGENSEEAGALVSDQTHRENYG